MKLVVSVNHTEEIRPCLENGADEVVLAVRGHSFTALKKTNLCDLPDDERVGLLVNKLYFPAEMDSMHKLLDEIGNRSFSSVYFADPAVAAYARNKTLCRKLIYRPDTLVTSSNDAGWWMNRGIASVTVSPLLTLEEIRKIVGHQKHLELIIHGYTLVSASRRKLVQAYLERNVDETDGLSIREESRDSHMPVYETGEGTLVYSDQVQQSFAYVREFAESGADRLYIEGVFMGTEELLDTVHLYRTILEKDHPETEMDEYKNKYKHRNLGEGYYGEKTIL
ncbi:MAG: U32 family peptidase [Solobacterium sp.]|nr:U32 family peptidase [Solobacterium sp.]